MYVHEDVTKHGGRDICHSTLKDIFANISQRQIQLFCEFCDTCQLKKSGIKKGVVVSPIVSEDFNKRCQVDLIDLQSQPDDEYKFVLVYQDHLSKFIILRALKRKTAEDVDWYVLM